MRKLATAAAVSLVLASTGVYALGLGDIEMRSALNQPMEAEIRLTSVKPGETDGMIVQLASPAAFARAGIERSPVLTGLQFAVEPGNDGPIIRITSRQPVLEPFLNFLLEVDWPQGRMVREYTVLLDPPVFMTPNATTRNSASDTPAQTQSTDNALIAPAPIERDQAADSLDVSPSNNTAGAPDSTEADGEVVSLDSLTPADSAARNPGGDASQGTSGALADNTPIGGNRPDGNMSGAGDDSLQVSPSADSAAGVPAGESEVVSLDGADAPVVEDITVMRGDTLYNIADMTRGTGVSVQQMMLALLEANQSAFINRNINLVKAGSILRVPGTDAQANLSQAAALAEISKQNDLWRDYRDNLRNAGATRLAQTDAADQEANAADGGGGDAADANEAEGGSDSENAALSNDAQSILDEARDEVRNRRDLSIVADNSSTSGAASATADESQTEESGRLAEINQKLKMAREELSSTRLQSQDLSEQSSDLQDTTENLDALMSLRQNEVAELEAQLAAAREAEAALAAEEAAAEAAEQRAAEVQAEADAKAAAEEAAEAMAASEAAATDEGGSTDAAASAPDGSDEQVAAADGGNGVSDNEYDQRENAPDALAGAGEEPGEVEALEPEGEGDGANVNAGQNAGQNAGENADQNAGENAGQNAGENAGQNAAQGAETEADAAAGEQAAASADEPNAADESATAETSGAWYRNLLDDPNKLAIAAIGALGLLGLLALLLRRRRKGADEEAPYPGEVQYIDDDEAESLQRQLDADDTVKVEELAPPVAAEAEPEAPVVAAGAASGQADDILSEADVYLAYGLHGQAEELLKSAVSSNPENPDYAHKLLQTYHAQGKADAYGTQAQAFHARFGGAANPAWESIAARGHELDPGNALYGRGGDEVSSLGLAGQTDSEFDANSFDLADEGAAGSVNRHFNDEDTADLSEDDLYSSSAEGRAETQTDLDATAATTYSDQDDDDFSDELDADLLDQSLDPALAFDESDLEATGDFSSLADELAAENEGSIDFTDFDAAPAAGEQKSESTVPAATAVVNNGLDTREAGDANADMAAIENELTFEELSLADMDSEEAEADLDGLDLSSPVSDELALDLESLGDEIDADGNTGGSVDRHELDLPDLNAGSDSLLSSGVAAGAGDEADDMDTMMDLARAYIDMGDKDSASNTLDEIVKSGSPAQVSEAETLLRKIS